MVSIIASKSKVKDGETVELTCTVPDFLDNIVIKQNGNNRAVQIKGKEFEAEPEYTVTKSEPDKITFTILQFSKSRDEGSWIITYGDQHTSTDVTLSAFIEITASTDIVKDGQRVVLSCTVPDFERSILIKQDGIWRGGCSFLSCGTVIEDYTIKIEGTTVILTINSFSKTRDVGSWSVNYGGYNESNPITLSACTDKMVIPVAGSIVAAVTVAAVAGIIYVAKKYCTSKNEETIHVEKGTHLTLGQEIPNAGKAVWEKNGKTFKNDQIEHVVVNGTMVHFHEALPTDSGSYVCTYGDNSKTLKYDLIVKELEKKDSA